MFSGTTLIFKTDNFGVSDAIAEILCRGASWTLDPRNSMKICENPEKFSLWFVDSFASSYYVLIMFFSFPGLQTPDKYKKSRA